MDVVRISTDIFFNLSWVFISFNTSKPSIKEYYDQGIIKSGIGLF